jgi:hypothetical protein
MALETKLCQLITITKLLESAKPDAKQSHFIKVELESQPNK